MTSRRPGASISPNIQAITGEGEWTRGVMKGKREEEERKDGGEEVRPAREEKGKMEEKR